MTTNKQNAKFGAQRSIAASTFTGSYQTLGDPLDQNASILIIQNDTDQTVTFSDDGVTDGITIESGTKMILDLRTNRTPQGSDFTFRVNTQFYVNGSVGTGTFYLSFLYAE